MQNEHKRNMKTIVRNMLIVLTLTMSMAANLLQFHGHDCEGHAKTSLVNLGCRHNHPCIDTHNPSSPHNNHSHVADCGLHLGKAMRGEKTEIKHSSHVSKDLQAQAVIPRIPERNNISNNEAHTIQPLPSLFILFNLASDSIPLRGSPDLQRTLHFRLT